MRSGSSVSSPCQPGLAITLWTITSLPSSSTPAASQPRIIGSRSAGSPTPWSDQRSWWLSAAALTSTSAQPSARSGSGRSPSSRPESGSDSDWRTAAAASNYPASASTRRARSTTGRSTISPRTASAPRPSDLRALELVDQLTRPRELGLGRPEAAVDRLELPGMDAHLPAHTERAGECHLLLQLLDVVQHRVHLVDRRPESRGGAFEHELRPREQHLLAVPPRLDPDLDREVDRAQREAGRASGLGDLPHVPETARRLDDRDHRGHSVGKPGKRLRGRLRQQDRVEREPAQGRDVVAVERRPGGVHPHRARGPAGRRLGVDPRRQLAPGRLLRRRRPVLPVGDDQVRAGRERLPQPLLVVARHEQHRAPALERKH